MHPVVEVRQLVILRPPADFCLVSIRSSVAVGPVTVALLQEFLILPLQILFEDDAADLNVVVLLSDPRFFFAVGGIQVGIVFELAGTVHTRVSNVPQWPHFNVR